MPLLRNMPTLKASRYGNDTDNQLLTGDGDWTLLGKRVSGTNIHPKKKGRPSTNKMTYDPLDNKTPFNCRWIKKSNTLQKGRAGDGGSRAATFASVGLAQSHAESLSNCVGFTHNKNINLYWFHYNIDNIINKQNCQKKRNWQWCDLYVREPLGLVKSAIIKTQPEFASKYLNVDDDKDEEGEEDGFIVNCDNDGLIDDPHMLPDNCGHFTVRKCLYSCYNFLNRCADTLSDLSDEIVEQRLVY